MFINLIHSNLLHSKALFFLSLNLNLSTGKIKVQTEDIASASASLSSVSVTSFMDKMALKEKEKADELLSRTIFSSQAPLALVESTQWQQFFKYLRPAYQVPSRNLISGPLLYKEHQRVTARVFENIGEFLSFVLTC